MAFALLLTWRCANVFKVVLAACSVLDPNCRWAGSLPRYCWNIVMPASQMRSTFHIQGCLAAPYLLASHNDRDFPLHSFHSGYNITSHIHCVASGDRVITTRIENHPFALTHRYFTFGQTHTGFYLLLLVILLIHVAIYLFINGRLSLYGTSDVLLTVP